MENKHLCQNGFNRETGKPCGCEWNLSEKIIVSDDMNAGYILTSNPPQYPKKETLNVEDVREFIKRLKEELMKCQFTELPKLEWAIKRVISTNIDKLAGEKLCT